MRRCTYTQTTIWLIVAPNVAHVYFVLEAGMKPATIGMFCKILATTANDSDWMALRYGETCADFKVNICMAEKWHAINCDCVNTNRADV